MFVYVAALPFELQAHKNPVAISEKNLIACSAVLVCALYSQKGDVLSGDIQNHIFAKDGLSTCCLHFNLNFAFHQIEKSYDWILLEPINVQAKDPPAAQVEPIFQTEPQTISQCKYEYVIIQVYTLHFPLSSPSSNLFIGCQ